MENPIIEINLSDLTRTLNLLKDTKRTFSYLENLLGNAIYKSYKDQEEHGMFLDIKNNITSIETTIETVKREMNSEIMKGIRNDKQQGKQR